MNTVIGKQYCVTCDSACDIVDTATGNTIHTHHAGEAQSYFTAIGIDSEPSDNTAVVTEVFKSAPAGNGGGGYIESNLNVGHGAADAVAAVCTLTLGDLATGGTLADSNGQFVELENPHKYATGTVSIPDATAAGTLTIGEWSKEWEAAPGTRATGWLQLAAGSGVFRVNGVPVNTPDDYTDVDAWNEELEPCGVFCTDETIESGSPKINIAAIEYGEAGNSITLEAVDEYAPVSGPTLTGGANGRTAVDVFNDILADEDCPVDVTLDADEGGLGFTAKEYGVNDEIAISGGLFSDASGMSGGHGDYTVEELVTAIGGGFNDITPTAGETEGTITLTADTPGAAANSITYTASGCFGSGTVKQGSTSRGRNAVEQTAFKIYLNGEELDVEPAPLPTALTPTTAMRNGGVYTVEEDIDARNVTLAEHASSTIVVSAADGPVPNVQLPAWKWCTADGLPPTMDIFRVYHIAVKDDGFYTSARLEASYAAATEYTHTTLTAENCGNDELELYFVKSETSKAYTGKETWTIFNNASFAYFFTNGWATRENLNGEAFTPSDQPDLERYEGLQGKMWQVVTFMTQAPIEVAGLTFTKGGGKNWYVFQAWSGGEWVTVGEGLFDELTTTCLLGAANRVTASKWRIFMATVSANGNCEICKVKIYKR